MSDEKEVKQVPLISRDMLGRLSNESVAMIARDLFKSDGSRFRLLSDLGFMAPEVIRERLSWLAAEAEGGG